MLAEIRKIREIAHRFEVGLPLGADHAEWLREGLSRFLRHECSSIDDALGLSFPRGGVPWWMEEAIRARDRALRALAHEFFADRSPAAKARTLYTLAVRYAASAWRIDRQSEDMPAHYRGTVKQYLWRAFRSGAAMPVSERTLRNILRP